MIKSISTQKFSLYTFLHSLSTAIMQMNEMLYKSMIKLNDDKTQCQIHQIKSPINQYIRRILVVSGIINKPN